MSIREDSTQDRCPECGAALQGVNACQEYFHELLALEWRVPGASGGLPHFFAVASFNLQHPSGFLPAALLGLRATLADVLAERADIAEARRRARNAADGPARVRRREEDVLSDSDLRMLNAWPTTWSATVLDVCRVAPEEYPDRVRAWAAAVSERLATVLP